jgi:hypothetical protein
VSLADIPRLFKIHFGTHEALWRQLRDGDGVPLIVGIVAGITEDKLPN